MTITGIERYKGNTYCIEMNNYQKIYVSGSIIESNNLKCGIDVSEEFVEDLTKQNDRRRARERALYCLDYREHSFMELYDKLCKNYSDEVALSVVSELADLGLINDRRYAEALAKQLMEVKGYGYYKSVMEMTRRGIDRDMADEILAEFEDSSFEKLRELVESKYEQYLVDYKGFQKVRSALSRRGFTYDDINSILDEYRD